MFCFLRLITAWCLVYFAFRVFLYFYRYVNWLFINSGFLIPVVIRSIIHKLAMIKEFTKKGLNVLGILIKFCFFWFSLFCNPFYKLFLQHISLDCACEILLYWKGKKVELIALKIITFRFHNCDTYVSMWDCVWERASMCTHQVTHFYHFRKRKYGLGSLRKSRTEGTHP